MIFPNFKTLSVYISISDKACFPPERRHFLFRHVRFDIRNMTRVTWRKNKNENKKKKYASNPLFLHPVSFFSLKFLTPTPDLIIVIASNEIKRLSLGFMVATRGRRSTLSDRLAIGWTALLLLNEIHQPGSVLFQEFKKYQNDDISAYQMDIGILETINFYEDRVISQIKQVEDLKEKANRAEGIFIITTETGLQVLIKEGFLITSSKRIDHREGSIFLIKARYLSP